MSRFSIGRILERLEKESVLSLVVEEDSKAINKVKNQLIQGKHRRAIEGKLCFSIAELDNGYVELTVSLLPQTGGPIKDVYTPNLS